MVDDVFMTVSGVSTGGTASIALAATAVDLSTSNVAASGDNVSALSSSASPSTTTAQAGIKVTLGSTATTDDVYSNLATPYSLAWAAPPTDDISKQMENNLAAHAKTGLLSSLLNGLGSQLLGRFATTQRDFQQTVASYRSNPSSVGATTGAKALQSAQISQNNISLKIYTKSGKEVDISITFDGDGRALPDSLSIDVHTSGTLSAAEQAAIAKLSKGLDAALQGISGGSPKIDFSGLVNFDTTVLSGIDLNVRQVPQFNGLRSIDLHVDANRRSLAVQSKAGSISINVNLATPALWGSATQRQSAVQQYLNQFDAANQRAHGGAALLGQFKDAFSQLHSSYPAPGSIPAQQPAHTLAISALNAQDRSVLSGLADFKASMSGDFDNGSATKPITESGHIDYQVAQDTKIKGVAKSTGLSVLQTQTAKLVASYAKSRGDLQFGIASGNYDIYRIKDETSTTTAFSYADDKLKSAFVINLVNQSLHYEKLVDHKVVKETDTPHNTSDVQDISAQLKPSSWPDEAGENLFYRSIG